MYNLASSIYSQRGIAVWNIHPYFSDIGAVLQIKFIITKNGIISSGDCIPPNSTFESPILSPNTVKVAIIRRHLKK